jgi:transcriptional regulator with XRE-family HTH domain
MRLTQGEFAKKLNTSREMVNYWENGKRLINIGDIINLAKMTGISTDWLLGFDVPPLSYSNSAEDCRKTHLEELMDCLAELCKYASDVNPEEIASHIATDNLGEWTKAWKRSVAKVLDKAAMTTKQLIKENNHGSESD